MQHRPETSQSREMEKSKMPLHKEPEEAFCRAIHWNRGGLFTVLTLYGPMRWFRGSMIIKGRARVDRIPVLQGHPAKAFTYSFVKEDWS